MQTLLFLDIDPAVLADLLAGLTAHQHERCSAAAQELADTPAFPLLNETALRTLLIMHNLTARECDLVALDLMGHTRAEIAAICETSVDHVKKYWTGINTKLGVSDRHKLRRWVLAQYRASLMATPAAIRLAADEDTWSRSRKRRSKRKRSLLKVQADELLAE